MNLMQNIVLQVLNNKTYCQMSLTIILRCQALIFFDKEINILQPRNQAREVYLHIDQPEKVQANPMFFQLSV